MSESEPDELKAAYQLLDKERWNDAIQRLEALEASTDPDVADQARNFLAHAYAATGRNADSEAMIRRSIERRGEPNDSLGDQLAGLGVVVGRQGRIEEAEGILGQALDLIRESEPEMTVFVLRNIAYLYWISGQRDRASEIYDRMPACDADELTFVREIMKPFEEPTLPAAPLE